MSKTAFIYDKWLSSLGGGEMVACNLAVTLHDQGFKTTFITGQIIDPQIILQKLSIDMTGINFVQAFNDEAKIKQITRGADIFINASFCDYSESSAKKQLYYTSFPSEPQPKSLKSIFKNILFHYLSSLITPVEKISNQEYIFYSLIPSKKYSLDFSVVLENFSKTNLSSINYQIDNSKIVDQVVTINHFKNKIDFQQKVVAHSESIVLKISHPSDSQLSVKSLFLLPQFSKLISFIRSGNYPDIKARIKNFDLVLANSQYTSRWIKKYWNSESTVLYPPLDLIKPNSKIKKQKRICSVGRFFTLGHGKKQDIMIRAFKQLCDNGLKGWELHLAGGLGSEPTSQVYAKTLEHLSHGYPIFFHFNQSRQFIEELYLSSKIYWHAAGFGEDPQTSPIKFEHFGIAPVEAISAGCLPVLFNGGGLSEIVTTLGLNPKIHLFNTIDELVTNTQNIIDQNISLPKNVHSILENNFGLNRFKTKLKDIIKKL